MTSNDKTNAWNSHFSDPRYCIHSLSRIVPSRIPPETQMRVRKKSRRLEGEVSDASLSFSALIASVYLKPWND